jgi:hypothetical protein
MLSSRTPKPCRSSIPERDQRAHVARSGVAHIAHDSPPGDRNRATETSYNTALRPPTNRCRVWRPNRDNAQRKRPPPSRSSMNAEPEKQHHESPIGCVQSDDFNHLVTRRTSIRTSAGRRPPETNAPHRVSTRPTCSTHRSEANNDPKTAPKRGHSGTERDGSRVHHL